MSAVFMGLGGLALSSRLRSEDAQAQAIYSAIAIGATTVGVAFAILVGGCGRSLELKNHGLRPGETKVRELAKAMIFPLITGALMGGILGWAIYQCSRCISG